MSFTGLLTWQTKIYLFSYSWYQNIVHLFLINIHLNDFVLPNTYVFGYSLQGVSFFKAYHKQIVTHLFFYLGVDTNQIKT